MHSDINYFEQQSLFKNAFDEDLGQKYLDRPAFEAFLDGSLFLLDSKNGPKSFEGILLLLKGLERCQKLILFIATRRSPSSSMDQFPLAFLLL